MSTITSLEVRNFKRVKLVHLTLNDGLTVIGGRNAQGKSSILDGIIAVLCGDRYNPKDPVFAGQDKATITLTIDHPVISTVRKEFSPDGKARLVLRDRDGLLINKPQTLLKTLLGDGKPDAGMFFTLSEKQLAEELRRVTGVDTRALDAERQMVFDTRTIVAREARHLEGAMSEMPVYPDVPKTELSMADVMKQLRAAQEHNALVAQAQRDLHDAERDVNNAFAEAKRLQDAYNKARAAYHTAVEQRDKLQALAAGAELKTVDTTPIEQQMETIGETNERIAANRAQAQAHARYIAKRDEADALTAKLAAIDAKKAEMLASVKMPVPGLVVEGDAVTLNGHPLSSASTQERLEAGVRMCIASNPDLPFVPLYDASMFDDTNLATLAQIASEHGAQVLAEKVGTEGVDIVIEDGMVKENTK